MQRCTGGYEIYLEKGVFRNRKNEVKGMIWMSLGKKIIILAMILIAAVVGVIVCVENYVCLYPVLLYKGFRERARENPFYQKGFSRR